MVLQDERNICPLSKYDFVTQALTILLLNDRQSFYLEKMYGDKDCNGYNPLK